MKNIVEKFKVSMSAALVGFVLALCPLQTQAGASIQVLLPSGNTNGITAASTNTFKNSLVGSNPNAKEVFLTVGWSMPNASGSITNNLIIDTASLTGTNTIQGNNGYYQTNAATYSLISSGTNYTITNICIAPTSAGGGAIFYRFSIGNTNASSNPTFYMTNPVIIFATKTGL